LEGEKEEKFCGRDEEDGREATKHR